MNIKKLFLTIFFITYSHNLLHAIEDPFNAYILFIDKRSDEGLINIAIKDNIDLDDPVFTDISSYGMPGFIVEGIIPGDGFGSGSTVYAAYFELGDLLISLDCPWNFCDRQEFDLILRSFKLN